MVLASATSYFPEQARTLMRHSTVDKLTDEEWHILRQRHQQGDEQIRALYIQGQAWADQYDDLNFTPPYLSTITARTLIVYGDRDQLYPAHIALEMYTAIPHTYLWIVPNGGHLPIFNNPNAPFMTVVLPFLRGDWE